MTKKQSTASWDRLEEELMLLLNRRLFERGSISYEIYERAQSIIVSRRY